MAVELIAIGTSAGGLDALVRVLSPIERGYPLAIAVVQHRGLDDFGDYEAVLSRSLALPVCEAEDKQPIRAGQVHVAPADYHLLVGPGAFALSVDARVHHARPSIDVLFQSAAFAYRERLVAVLLTGASSDGTRGAEQVRLHGGQVVVQDPEEAASQLMPRSALPHADRVLTLDQIAHHLQVLGATAI